MQNKVSKLSYCKQIAHHQQWSTTPQMYEKVQLHCIADLDAWYCFNGLCLNSSKLGTCQHLLSFPTVPSVNIASSPVTVTDQIATLGIIINKHFTFDSHVSALFQKFFFSSSRPEAHTFLSLTEDMAASNASAMVLTD